MAKFNSGKKDMLSIITFYIIEILTLLIGINHGAL
jgi:hypothetical protein